MEKYLAKFTANNTSVYSGYFYDNNKKRLIKDIREIANGNRFKKNNCFWYVYNKYGECIAAGYTLQNGRKRRVPKHELHNYRIFQE